METIISILVIIILFVYIFVRYSKDDNSPNSNSYGGASGTFTELPKEVIE